MIKSNDQLAAEMRRLRRLNHDLIMHARAGEIVEVNECLTEGDINFKDAYGWTALMWGTYRNDVDLVELLIEKGATSTIKNNQDWPALCIAATLGHFEITKLLLKDRVANINIKGNGGLTPLMMASAMGNLDMVQLLLKRKARPNEQNFVRNDPSPRSPFIIAYAGGQTALMKCAEKGHLPIVITLLFHGAAIDIKDKDEKTAVHWARRRKRKIIVDLLKDWPGVPQIKRVGLTPLDWAKENLKEEVVQQLEEWKEQATPKCTTDMRKVQDGNTVTDLDCVWVDDLAGVTFATNVNGTACVEHGMVPHWTYICANSACKSHPA